MISSVGFSEFSTSVSDRLQGLLTLFARRFGPGAHRSSASLLRSHRRLSLLRRVGPEQVARLRFVTSVDHTGEDWQNCVARGGGADRSELRKSYGSATG